VLHDEIALSQHRDELLRFMDEMRKVKPRATQVGLARRGSELSL